MQHIIRHGGSIAAYTAHDKCPQAQTNISRAEAEASGASEKLWLRMQNNRQAGGKPCENQNNFSENILIQLGQGCPLQDRGGSN